MSTSGTDKQKAVMLLIMDEPLLFWLILLASWFIYNLRPGIIKGFLLILSPLSLVAISFADLELVVIWATIVLSLSHARYFEKRYGQKRTARILKRTWILALLTSVLLGMLTVVYEYQSDWILGLIAGTWAIVSIKALLSAIKRTISNKFIPVSASSKVKKRTVTLAIPARNETHVLTDCLRSAIASDYPKLEILVLDDCSSDSTPEIIKSFAHDGVRFVSGHSPSSGWIGKNHAYEALLEEASGEIVIFAGVDSRWHSNSISQIIDKFSAAKLHMMSVMPYRNHFDIWPSMTRTIRYYWQLAFAKLPVMNSVWAVDRSWLIKNGGFKQYKHEVLPEKRIAALANDNQKYQFSISNHKLGVSSRKHASSQYETAIRTLYPQFAKDPLIALLWSIAWFAAVSVWIAGWLSQVPLLLIGSFFASLSFLLVERSLQPNGWVISMLFLPLSLVSQGVLSAVSMLKFEFGMVDWKGRNICLPAMNQTAYDETYPPKNQPSA